MPLLLALISHFLANKPVLKSPSRPGLDYLFGQLVKTYLGCCTATTSERYHQIKHRSYHVFHQLLNFLPSYLSNPHFRSSSAVFCTLHGTYLPVCLSAFLPPCLPVQSACSTVERLESQDTLSYSRRITASTHCWWMPRRALHLQLLGSSGGASICSSNQARTFHPVPSGSIHLIQMMLPPTATCPNQ